MTDKIRPGKRDENASLEEKAKLYDEEMGYSDLYKRVDCRKVGRRQRRNDRSDPIRKG
jgi:hypothetical protein